MTTAVERRPLRARTAPAVLSTAGSAFAKFLLYGMVLLVFAGPFWMVLSTAFSADSFRPGQLAIFPSSFTVDNIVAAWSKHSVGRYFWNSVVVVVVGLVLQVAVSTLAAYALSRRRFRGASVVLFLILATMMLSEEIIAVPLYLVLGDLPVVGGSLLDSYAGMILPVAAWGFSIFILTQFMRRVPEEIEESARIDGAGEFRIFFQIVLPLIRPALATAAVFGFLMIWDQYMLPLIVAQSNEMMTLPIALQSLRQNELVGPNVILAASLIALLPTLFMYLALQRHYASGLAAGATKG